MNSLQESDDPDTCQNNNFNYKTLANLGNAQDTLDNLVNLERFLPQSNHIMVNLKLKLIDQVIANDNERAQFEEIAIKFCFELLQMARLIAPGKSKLRGKYCQRKLTNERSLHNSFLLFHRCAINEISPANRERTKSHSHIKRLH